MPRSKIKAAKKPGRKSIKAGPVEKPSRKTILVALGGDSEPVEDSPEIEMLYEEPDNPTAGDVYFDRITDTIRVFDGSSWVDVKRKDAVPKTWFNNF